MLLSVLIVWFFGSMMHFGEVCVLSVRDTDARANTVGLCRTSSRKYSVKTQLVEPLAVSASDFAISLCHMTPITVRNHVLNYVLKEKKEGKEEVTITLNDQ